MHMEDVPKTHIWVGRFFWELLPSCWDWFNSKESRKENQGHFGGSPKTRHTHIGQAATKSPWCLIAGLFLLKPAARQGASWQVVFFFLSFVWESVRRSHQTCRTLRIDLATFLFSRFIAEYRKGQPFGIVSFW